MNSADLNSVNLKLYIEGDWTFFIFQMKNIFT